MEEINERITATKALNKKVRKNLDKRNLALKKIYDDNFLVNWDFLQWQIEDELYNKSKKLIDEIEIVGNKLLLKILEKRNIQKKHFL